MPTLGVAEQGRAGCFSTLDVLIAAEREVVEPTDDDRNPPFTAAVVKEEERRGAAGNMSGMRGRNRERTPRASRQPARKSVKVSLSECALQKVDVLLIT